MDILEHPLEAVAFRLYSLPDASGATGAAAWTCLAAVLAAAAAAGLWRLRSFAPAAGTAALNPLDLEPSKAKEMSPEKAISSARPSPDSAASTTAAPSPKERYTAYYRDSGRVGCCDVDGDEEEEEAEEQDEDDDGGVHQTSEMATDPFGWEAVRSLPLGPTTAAGMGRHRSPTALGGSVVRLWDEAVYASVTAAWSPRWRGGRVVGTVSAF